MLNVIWITHGLVLIKWYLSLPVIVVEQVTICVCVQGGAIALADDAVLECDEALQKVWTGHEEHNLTQVAFHL